MTEFKRNRHALYKLSYHLVVVTKYRHKCINENIMKRLKEIAEDLFSGWDCEIIEMNGEEDHVHILFDAPPQIQLSKIINSFKTVSSRYIRKEFQEDLKPFYWKPYFWSHSYMVLTTGGATIEVIKKYIENQGK
ncbi:IS200/IS605 family transposase [Bacillus thuringiensis]|uniref:IS200/IS605 family transposase n=1 Tax=Bacillus thuringiensis TaxID=1428 RepID=A0A9X6ZV18_BACTU|nr:IS200/IS605 family transposase [Bacillus thuringiensis]PFJ42800.1 IS200/IS605 family transposase [Bacillus thuringiensis]